MKHASVALSLLAAMTMVSHAAPSEKGPDVLETLLPAIQKATSEFDQIDAERKQQLEKVAAFIREHVKAGKPVELTTICTHNSRRSHLSQLWAQAAACYYGLEGVTTYSGGTEEAACNYRTVRALRRAGFSIAQSTEGENPVYLAQYSENHPPSKLYSKVFDTKENPQKDFVALFVCDHAAESCPVVPNAGLRIPILYVDPKASDGTPAEDATYDERCQQIAREMLYLMSKV
ncbi:MAG TPA: protein-tyrosine-phosphatase [Bacteroidia bacterium]|nr:protein-tyrosine-phosphatase [Bacteroidia bacterium]